MNSNGLSFYLKFKEKFYILQKEIDGFLGEYVFFYQTSFVILSLLLFSPFVVFHGFFDSYTIIKWVFILYSANLSILMFLFKTKSLILPKLSRLSLYIIALIVCFLLFNSYLHDVSLFSYENTRRFLFWGIAIFFLNLFWAEKEEAFHKIEKAICITLTVFLFLSLSQYIFRPHIPPYLTFGNINLAAEFVGFLLIFPFGALTRLWRESKKSIPLNLLSAASISYLYLTHCRSTYIGVFIIISAAFYLYKAPFKEVLKILTTAIIITIFIKGLVPWLYPEIYPEINLLPPLKGFSSRGLLYIDTLKMIIENPLGVGVGRYEFASLPYLANIYPQHNETMIFLSPHNEFLHYLVEDGVILSLLFLLLTCSVIYFYWNDVKRIFMNYPEFIYFSIFLFVQSLFQFPLIESLPFFLTAMMIGYFFSFLKKDCLTYNLKHISRLTLIGVNFLAFMIFTVSFLSKYISYNFPNDQNLNKMACSFGNRDWFACLNVASTYINKGDYDKAESYALRTLTWQPLNYQGMKILGFVRLYQGNTKKACELFKKYDSFFQNKTTLHELIAKKCPDFL